ncbi:MAG: ABC transporter ATP-binding protein [Deltaproteobacteria bacterium]|nr:ABC transporter ATP-binding protein [Deltaproteobacteria bacterium]
MSSSEEVADAMSENTTHESSKSSNPLLQLSGLGRRYGERWGIRNLNASLEAGEVVGFLGPNGAGKTTTIKMIAGLLVPSEGHVVIDGNDVMKESELAKEQLSYIPDRPSIPPRLSARELLEYIAGLHGLDGDVVNRAGIPALARFGLEGREDDLLGIYSHGMRQRALLAAAWMRNPKVWLVDEPMVGLDPQGARLVKQTLRQAADKGATVLLSTHSLDVAEEICDRVLVLRQGELVAQGAIAELRSQLPEGKNLDDEANLEELIIALTGESAEVSVASADFMTLS